MKFKCHKCNNAIVVKHISSGDTAECKKCKAPNIVPQKEGDVGLVCITKSKEKGNVKLSDCEKQNLFNKLWTLAMALAAYGAFIIYILARAKAMENTFPFKEVILSNSFGMIFGVFGFLIAILGIGVIEFILITRIAGMNLFYNLSLFTKYGNAKQYVPLFIMLILIAISELTIFIFDIT